MDEVLEAVDSYRERRERVRFIRLDVAKHLLPAFHGSAVVGHPRLDVPACVKLRRAALQDLGRQRTVQRIEFVAQGGPR